jgi:alpha-N-arabinofuranosidase
VGTYYADLRARNGHPEPHNVRYWCVGNEMDGPWQIGHLGAHEYALKALEAAKLMKWHDPGIQLILCGSSNDAMPTYPEWDRVALEACWEKVDYLSMHYYAGNRDDDSTSYLASAAAFEAFVDTLAGTLRYVKAKCRSKHDVYLSWDEWQVWYKDRSGRGGWTEAPHLSEEIYNLEDALVVAQWLNVFLRKCDVVKIACVAQIVNVISWLHTTREGLLKQASFYPFQLVSTLARGDSLDLLVRAPATTRPRARPRFSSSIAARPRHCPLTVSGKVGSPKRSTASGNWRAPISKPPTHGRDPIGWWRARWIQSAFSRATIVCCCRPSRLPP